VTFSFPHYAGFNAPVDGLSNQNQIKIVLLTTANAVKGMEGQKKSDILHHP